MSKPQRRWSPQEDAILQKEVEAQVADNHGVVRDWNSIAQKIDGRSNKDCRKRFYNGIAEGLKKGPWTTLEDQNLERLVNKYGSAWAVIAQEIETRSADQCSKRWQHCLDPELDRSTWSTEENLALMTAVKTHESAWKDIQRLHFPSRSANNVKNQYSVLKRKNIEVPQDTPPCCTTWAEKGRGASQRETNISRISSDSSGLLGQFSTDMDPAFDELTNTNDQNPEVDQSYPYPIHQAEDAFPQTQSRAMTPKGLTHDSGPFGFRGVSTMDLSGNPISSIHPMNIANHEESDFDMWDALPSSGRGRQTQPTDARHNSTMDAPQNADGIGSSGGNAFEWPYLSDAGGLQYKSQSPNSASATASLSPVTSNMQTTIRLEDSDPSTLSAVIGMLIGSNARFKLETR